MSEKEVSRLDRIEGETLRILDPDPDHRTRLYQMEESPQRSARVS